MKNATVQAIGIASPSRASSTFSMEAAPRRHHSTAPIARKKGDLKPVDVEIADAGLRSSARAPSLRRVLVERNPAVPLEFMQDGRKAK